MKRYLRKVQLTGRSTFIVSIPKSWAVKHGLKPGSPVIVEESNSTIIVKPTVTGGQHETKRIVLGASQEKNPETVVRWVIGAYVMGYDEIVVKSESGIQPQLRNALRSAVLSKLPAAEIVNEDVNEIQVQVILSHEKSPLTTALRRLAKIVLSVIGDSCNVIVARNPELADEILKEDDSIDRVYFYVNRLINMVATGRIESTTEELNPVDLVMYRSVAKLLERIGDHAVNIARCIRELGSATIPGEVYKLCLDTMNVCQGAIEAFFARNPHYIQDVASFVDYVKSVEKSIIEEGMKTLKPGELMLLKLVLESLRRISEYSKDVAELALDLSLEKVAL